MNFTDENSIIPSLTLKHHLKKIYPFVNEQKISLFLVLADINGDGKIEVNELLTFFAELAPLVNAETVINGIA